MNDLEQFKLENEKIVSDITQLVDTENSRILIVTSVFARTNNEMRLKNIQDIKKDICYKAKSYGVYPDKYTSEMDSIVRAYILEINEFMKVYNDQFINIQNILKKAQEDQKYYFYEIRKNMMMKKICELVGKKYDDYSELDSKIQIYRKKIGIYEKIIEKCDNEFKECTKRREEDFKDIFEIKQDLSLMVIEKSFFFINIIKKIINSFRGYNSFSKNVLKKYATNINRVKIEIIEKITKKTRMDSNSFSNEIEMILESV